MSLLVVFPCAGTFGCTDGCPVSRYDSLLDSIHLTVPSCGASLCSSLMNSCYFRVSVSQTVVLSLFPLCFRRTRGPTPGVLAAVRRLPRLGILVINQKGYRGRGEACVQGGISGPVVKSWQTPPCKVYSRSSRCCFKIRSIAWNPPGAQSHCWI